MSETSNLIELHEDEEPMDGAGPWACVTIAADGHTAAFTLHDHNVTHDAPANTANDDGEQALLWALGWADSCGGLVYVRRG